MPVESMSRRALIGMVHAVVRPGAFIARSISSTSAASEMRSRQNGRSAFFSHSDAQLEYQRGFSRHSDSGLRTMVVSIIENGAGSVDVSALPALPKTVCTSGKPRRMRSCVCRIACASPTDMPGSVVGI